MQVRQASAGLLFLIITMLLHTPCGAGTPEEIASLLLFVEQSECTFIRNGNHYNARQAREHIEKKYMYFKKQITTAEDFILYSATKSTMTGKPYSVICQGTSMKSRDWLHAELANIRKIRDAVRQ